MEKKLTWEFDNVDVYQFGSSLYSEIPNDIDVLIVYDDKSRNEILKLICFRKDLKFRLEELLGLPGDIILLSSSEEAQLCYLEQIDYKKIF